MSGMVIAHNLSSMFSNRQLGITTNNKAKSSERLSSGYKINRAADDAAGLSISEKMRKQIRALNQGANNITDGISLVQVADSALEEITQCLQRTYELSVKAYNGTCSASDRKSIQSEIAELKSEIQRTADTTKFNEIYVLQGDPVKTITITDSKIETQTAIVRYKKDLPDWLNVSDLLEQSNSSILSGYSQDTGVNAVFQNGDGNYKYYGNRNNVYDSRYGNDSYGGQWTSNLTDNASAIIDFSNFSNIDDADDLYSKLFDLMGCAIGVPCGTCNAQYYGVGFYGSIEGNTIQYPSLRYEDRFNKARLFNVQGDSGVNVSELEVTVNGEKKKVFDAITEMNKRQKHPSNTQTDVQKKAEVSALAHQIMDKLVDETFKSISSSVKEYDHFTKTIKIGNNKIALYDFRDENKLPNGNEADSIVLKKGYSYSTIVSDLLIPGTTGQIQTPIEIQAGTDNKESNRIPIKLPLIDEDHLGITGYDISTYETTVTYSESYEKALAEWERNNIRYITTQVTEPATGPTTYTAKELYKHDYNSVGEWVPFYRDVVKTSPGKPERTYNVTTKQYLGLPKPQPGEGDVTITTRYNPSDFEIISDALKYVSNCRSLLGATQNRLEHAYKVNTNTSENTQASESIIRDTDMASEMVKYSKETILQQAGQSMLAQANQSNQGVLSLLQ